MLIYVFVVFIIFIDMNSHAYKQVLLLCISYPTPRFFQEKGLMAVYHDRYPDFREEVRELLVTRPVSDSILSSSSSLSWSHLLFGVDI